MVTIKSTAEVKLMRYAADVVLKIHQALRKQIIVGQTGNNLDLIAAKIIKENGCISNFKGYGGFPKTICVSVNNQLVHGIPSDYKFLDGDIVSVDAGCKYQNYHADAAFSVIVGTPKLEIHKKVVDVTRKSLDMAIQILKPGVRIGAISETIQKFVEKQNLYLPTSYAGHGIGLEMHEDPIIPNVGLKNKGMKLKPGMVICIEPMVQIGTNKTITAKDGWTVLSQDGSYSAHFEDMILITETGHEVLTKSHKDIKGT